MRRLFLLLAGLHTEKCPGLVRNRMSKDKLKRNRRLGMSYVIGQGPHTSREMLEAAILAEKCGFDSVFMPEHYYDREAGSVLGAIAQSTSKVKIGTGVINPYTRFPSLIAMTVATLDELSNGRIILGLGSGGVIGSLTHGIPNEFAEQAYGYPVGHLREIVLIVRRLLAGERVTFHGKHYSLDRVQLNFKPIQRDIPIYFGQQGPRMMDLAGQIADGVLITLCCTVPYVKDVIRRIRNAQRTTGRKSGSFDFAARIVTSLSKKPQEATRLAKQIVGRVFIHPGAKPVMNVTGIDLDIPSIKKAVHRGKSEKLNELVPNEVVELTTASGTKKEVINKVEEFRMAGVTHPLIVPIGKNYTEIIRIFQRKS